MAYDTSINGTLIVVYHAYLFICTNGKFQGVILMNKK